MIWGAKVSAAAPHAVTFDTDILRLTNAVIDTTEMAGQPFSTQLFLKDGKKDEEFLLCTFTQDNHSANMNLEIDEDDGAQFVVRGPGTVHLTGHLDYIDDDDELTDESDEESPVPMAN